MKEATAKPVNASKADNLKLSWRDARYHRFYDVVDQLVDELQEHVWVKTGKAKRRLKGDGLEKLYYSVECLVRDCMRITLRAALLVISFDTLTSHGLGITDGYIRHQ